METHTKDCYAIRPTGIPGDTKTWDPYSWNNFNTRKKEPPTALLRNEHQEATKKEKKEISQALLNLSDMWQITMATNKRARKNKHSEGLWKKQLVQTFHMSNTLSKNPCINQSGVVICEYKRAEKDFDNNAWSGEPQ